VLSTSLYIEERSIPNNPEEKANFLNNKALKNQTP
jgi:hypothetical protein